MKALTMVLLSLSLLLMACAPDSGGAAGDDGKQQAEELEAARTRVLDDVTPVLSDLTAALPARLRFSLGNYDACKNDFGGATAVTYRVNGRVDATGGGDPVAAARRALEGAGFEVAATSDEVTVEGAKGETTVTFSTLDGQHALLFAAKDSGCYGIGGDRAKALGVDKDPITLG
jgi:hypothetical protein